MLCTAQHPAAAVLCRPLLCGPLLPGPAAADPGSAYEYSYEYKYRKKLLRSITKVLLMQCQERFYFPKQTSKKRKGVRLCPALPCLL